ncbi:hypothetical protein BJD99_00515 [Rhodococcus sp. 1163]|nr:hypothetical protein BJD99_00515 [Rhodococcus sp. 1163]
MTNPYGRVDARSTSTAFGTDAVDTGADTAAVLSPRAAEPAAPRGPLRGRCASELSFPPTWVREFRIGAGRVEYT